MRKPDVEKILTEGSMRQKIKLFFTDTAIVNATLGEGKRLLTKEQRESISKGVFSPKDLAYYNDLRTWNKVFLLVRPLLDKTGDKIRYLGLQLEGEIRQSFADYQHEDSINELLEGIEDPAKRTELAERAIKKLVKQPAKIERGADGLAYITIENPKRDEFVAGIVEQINVLAYAYKDLALTLKILVARHIPLKPYKDYVKTEEGLIMESLKNYHEILSIHYKHKMLTDERYVLWDYDSLETEANEQEVDQLRSLGT
jgi:hypothetical protein